MWGSEKAITPTESPGSEQQPAAWPAVGSARVASTQLDSFAGSRHACCMQCHSGDGHHHGKHSPGMQTTDEQGSAQSTTPVIGVQPAAPESVTLDHTGSTEGSSEPTDLPAPLGDAKASEQAVLQAEPEPAVESEVPVTEDPESELDVTEVVQRGMALTEDGNDKGCQVCLPMPHDVWRIPAPAPAPVQAGVAHTQPEWGNDLDPMTILAMAAAELPSSPRRSTPNMTQDDSRLALSCPMPGQDPTVHSGRSDPSGHVPGLQPSAGPSTMGTWPGASASPSQHPSNTIHTTHQVPNTGNHAQATDEDGQPLAPGKKQRLAWTPELHARFVKVVDTLGLHTAVPKTILRMMDVKGLTREQVASHLQKYRLYMKKGGGGSQTALTSSSPGDVYMAPYRAPAVTMNGSVSLIGRAASGSPMLPSTSPVITKVIRSRSGTDLTQLVSTSNPTPPATASTAYTLESLLATQPLTHMSAAHQLHSVVPLTAAHLQALPQLAAALQQQQVVGGSASHLTPGTSSAAHRELTDRSVHGGDTGRQDSSVHAAAHPGVHRGYALHPDKQPLSGLAEVTVVSREAADGAAVPSVVPGALAASAVAGPSQGRVPSSAQQGGVSVDTNVQPAVPKRPSTPAASSVPADAQVTVQFNDASQPAATMPDTPEPAPVSAVSAPVEGEGPSGATPEVQGEGAETRTGTKRKAPEEWAAQPSPAPAPAIRMLGMLPAGISPQQLAVLLQQQQATHTANSIPEDMLQPVITLSAGERGRRASSTADKTREDVACQSIPAVEAPDASRPPTQSPHLPAEEIGQAAQGSTAVTERTTADTPVELQPSSLAPQFPGFTGSLPFHVRPVVLNHMDSHRAAAPEAHRPTDAQGATRADAAHTAQTWAGGPRYSVTNGGDVTRLLAASGAAAGSVAGAPHSSSVSGALVTPDSLSRLQVAGGVTQQGIQIVPVLLGSGQAGAGYLQAMGAPVYTSIAQPVAHAPSSMRWVTTSDGSIMAVRSDLPQAVVHTPQMYMLQPDGTLALANPATGAGGMMLV